MPAKVAQTCLSVGSEIDKQLVGFCMDERFQKFALGILLLVGVLRCSPKSPVEPARGVQVGGGGSGLVSTPAQVNAALDEAIDLVTRPPQKNIVVQFWIDQGRKNSDSRISRPTHLFPGIMQNGQITDLSKNPNAYGSPMLKAIGKNKLIRLTSGDCLNTATEKHKEASVSVFNLSADICFSIGDLARFPPSEILREVLSLALHEAVHMGGGDEGEAVAWQDAFYDYFGTRFGELSAHTVTDPTLQSFLVMGVLLDHAENAAKLNPNDPSIFSRVGKIADEIQKLPYSNDPLAIELKIQPPHPELIDNYSNAVLALAQKITGDFNIQHHDSGAVTESLMAVTDAAPSSSIYSSLEEIGRGLEQIKENFLAVISTTSTAHSTCVKLNDSSQLWIERACPASY